MNPPKLKLHPREFSSYCSLIANSVNLLAELISADPFRTDYHRNFACLQELHRKNAIQLARLAHTYRRMVTVSLNHDTAFALMECTIPSQNNSYLENLAGEIKKQIHDHYYKSVDGDLIAFARRISNNQSKLLAQ